MNDIPWEAARDFARAHGLSHIVILAHDGKQDQVVTYGEDVLASASAAQMGNKMKADLGWPESLFAMSSRAEKVVQAACDFVHNVEHHHIENAVSFTGDESFKQLAQAVQAKA